MSRPPEAVLAYGGLAGVEMSSLIRLANRTNGIAFRWPLVCQR